MLEVRGLRKRFGSVTALDGVDMTVARGQLVGFLGPNGAGKTTTMRAILGLISVDAGTVTWDGGPIDAGVRRRIGYMPAERGMYPTMRVEEQVVYFARLAGMDRPRAEAAAARWLARVDLTDRAGTKVQDLSSGNQQRVQLAIALVHDPELLVLDEPFSGLDPLAVDVLKDVLLEQVAAGVALLFSSHQLDLVEDLGRDVVIIDRGSVVLSGDVARLRATSPYRYVEISFSGDPDPTWTPPGEVLERADHRLTLRVDASRDPAEVLAGASRAGTVATFSFLPPELSEVFVAAVSPQEHGEDQR